MMSKQVLATLVAAFIACTLLAQPVAGVSFFLRSGEETCLMQDVIRGEHISGEFSVLPQGDVITVYVRDPTNAVVYHKLAATEGKFAFTSPESGEYKACFSNTADNKTQKTVRFKVTTGAEARAQAQGARKKTLKPLEVQVKHLEEIITGIRNDELWMNARQEKMRAVNDSTASRIFWFNIFSFIVLVMASLLQLWYLKRYFRSKKLVD